MANIAVVICNYPWYLKSVASFWATILYRTVVCVYVYLVTLVYSGQTVGWIKMSRFGMEVDLGPGDIALAGDPTQ